MASKNGEWAHDRWEEHYGEKPIWATKDWVNLTKVEKLTGDRFRDIWTTYLQERGKFFQGHPPSKLLANLGQFQVAAPQAPPPARLFQPQEEEANPYWTEEKVKATRKRAFAAQKEAERLERQRQEAREAREQARREELVRPVKMNRDEAREALRRIRRKMNEGI